MYDALFDYEGHRYRGKGWLRWKPDTGGHVDISADFVRPPSGVISRSGCVGWLKPEHYTTIRMGISGFDWVVAPQVGLVNRFDIDFGSYLSVPVPRLIWRDSFPSQKATDVCGHITLGFHNSTRLFSPLRETISLEDRKLCDRDLDGKGVLAEVDGIEICGRLDSEHRARIEWTAPGLPRPLSWAFGHSLRVALCLCTGCSAALLERQIARSGRTYRELRPYREPSRLADLSWFPPVSGPTGSECLELALALVADRKLETMAWGVFSQLVDSLQQRSWGSSELLVSLILEGILRTLDNQPFVPCKTINLPDTMKRLRKTVFPSITKQQCEDALAAQRRLRHHNAHPDWLSTEERFSHAVLTQASHDMAYLSRFYGRIIFEAAGLPATASRIPLDG